MTIWYEALVVGIAIGVIGFLVSLAIMYYTDPNFSLAKYHFWKEVVVSYILTGIVAHLLFEYFGANAWYCRHGVACQSN